jgi:hypothetical protein
MLREGRTTRLTPISKSGAGISVDPLLQAVREAAAADFDVLGEIGRGGGGIRVYLAREASTGVLVVLRLERDPDANEFTLDLLRRLDQSVPATLRCLNCACELGGWMRFCTHCGADLSSAEDGAGSAAQRARMQLAVRGAVADEYDVLGEMQSKEGQGAVFFARELASGEIVALRLQREADDSYSVGRTMALKPFAAELGVTDTMAAAPETGSVTAPQQPEPVVPAPVDLPRAPEVTPPAAPKRWTRSQLLLGGGAILGTVTVAALLLSVPSSNQPDTKAVEAVATQPPPLSPVPSPIADTHAVAPVPPPVVKPTPRVTGRVRIAGIPAGARVRVDGKLRSSRNVDLAAGRHTISIEATGYSPYESAIEVRSGETIAWQPELAPTAVSQPATHKPAEPAAPQPLQAVTDTAAPLVSCSASYNAKQWTAAFQSCSKEANAGQAQAQFILGNLYEKGRGTKKSKSESRLWYEKASQQGQKDATKRIEELDRQAARDRRPF